VIDRLVSYKKLQRERFVKFSNVKIAKNAGLQAQSGGFQQQPGNESSLAAKARWAQVKRAGRTYL
jgi:hypothetical protein